jgi:chromosome segregation ATPase
VLHRRCHSQSMLARKMELESLTGSSFLAPTPKCCLQDESAAEALHTSRLQDPNSTEEQLSTAKDALDMQTSKRRQAQARVEACQEKISFLLEEIGAQGAYSDTESQSLSMRGLQVQVMVLDWTLEMLLASEERTQQAVERHTQLEAALRQMTVTNKDVEGQKSSTDAALKNMSRKMKEKMVEVEQLRQELVVANRSRDKINQELTSLKEDIKQCSLLLKEAKRETEAAKQKLVVRLQSVSSC